MAKSQVAYFIAIVAVPALNALIFSEATAAKSSLTLLEGYPVGRIQPVVLSTHSTATDFPFLAMMFLIKVLETYCADMVVLGRECVLSLTWSTRRVANVF